ncbi:MAG: FecR domain-containing protein, partial [Deltaproteobacteria bacterium]|nr:FecR domain-containing protein [Deltaproteobacteria bacterium]
MTRKYLSVMFAILALILALACTAHAAPVGRFLKLEGHVDLLKGGKLPARAAKVTEPVELKDVIRTKSKSRAQVLFVDDTILTLAPETRVAVADYFYDGAQGRRRALLQVFRGLAHTVVKQVLKLQEPDFIMQTQTVVIGVRGTEWYTLNLPNGTNVYNIDGLLELTSSNRLIPGSLLLPALKY